MNKKKKADRLAAKLPELARMSRAQLEDPAVKMSPAFFRGVLNEFLRGMTPGGGEVFFDAKRFDEALTVAGYWDDCPRDYGQRHDHAAAMLEYMELCRKATRRDNRRLLSEAAGGPVM